MSDDRRAAALRTAAGLGLLALCASIFLIHGYGVTWDVANGEIPHGERYLGYLTTGDERFFDLSPEGRRPENREPHLDDRVQLMPWNESYPLSAILSAVSCRVLWTWLGAASSLTAHLLIAPLFAALLVFVVAWFAAAFASRLSAISAAAFLFFSPRFLAHAHNNLKDTPEVALYFLATVLVLLAFTRGGTRLYLAAGVIAGLALAQKPNALFLPAHACVLLVALIPAARLLGRRVAIRVWPSLLGLLLFALVWIAVSPRMWSDPVGRAAERLAFLFGVATERGVWHPFEGLKMVAFTTPPVVLGLAALGLFHRGVSLPVRVFLAVGFLFPLARTALPGFVNFDGVRHYLEFFPPLAVLAGIGADGAARLAARVAGGGFARSIGPAVAAASIAPVAIAGLRLHPDGVCYFNALCGGLDGARARGIPEATDYWASSYRRGMERIARADRRGPAELIVPVAEHVARCQAPVLLPEGVEMADRHARGAGETFVMFVTREPWYDATARWLAAEREPWFRIEVDSEPILLVYRLAGDDARRAHELWAEGRASVYLLLEVSRRFGHGAAATLRARIRRAAAEGDLEGVAIAAELPVDLRPDVPLSIRFERRRQGEAAR